jgi:hypothetical protein
MTPQDPQQPQGQPVPPQAGPPVPPQSQPNLPGPPPVQPNSPMPPNQGQQMRPPMPPPNQGQPGRPPTPPNKAQAGPPPVPPNKVQPGPVPQPGQVRPDYQWQPAQPPTGGSGAATPTQAQPQQSLAALLAAFRPEPAKAPPLEWVGLAVSLILFICGFLPWINLGTGGTLSGLDIGDGWIVMGAGLVAAILGFVGLSRDSIALAAGQALVGLIALGFVIINLVNPGTGDSPAFGLFLTLIVALIVIGLGVYNAIDAQRKGAKY